MSTTESWQDAQQDLVEHMRPSDSQVALAQAAMRSSNADIAYVALVLPGKTFGWWERGQTVVAVEGVVFAASSGWVSSLPTLMASADARNHASEVAKAILGERKGTVAYVSVRHDGTWSVFEDFANDEKVSA